MILFWACSVNQSSLSTLMIIKSWVEYQNLLCTSVSKYCLLDSEDEESILYFYQACDTDGGLLKYSDFKFSKLRVTHIGFTEFFFFYETFISTTVAVLTN